MCMSKKSYKYKYNISKHVKYEYWTRKGWKSGIHVCYAQTDDEAVKSCYWHNQVLVLRCDFHVVEITTVYT